LGDGNGAAGGGAGDVVAAVGGGVGGALLLVTALSAYAAWAWRRSRAASPKATGGAVSWRAGTAGGAQRAVVQVPLSALSASTRMNPLLLRPRSASVRSIFAAPPQSGAATLNPLRSQPSARFAGGAPFPFQGAPAAAPQAPAPPPPPRVGAPGSAREMPHARSARLLGQPQQGPVWKITRRP
jgi:hypothetical protein